MRVGFRMTGRATFTEPVENVKWVDIVRKSGAYWLRYEKRDGASGRFAFFVFVDGAWSQAAVFQKSVEVGSAYRFEAGWNGFQALLAIDGTRGVPARCMGPCRPSRAGRVVGTRGKVDVDDLSVTCENLARVAICDVRTRELLPRRGSGVTLVGRLANIGCSLDGWALVATAGEGVGVTPSRIDLPHVDEYAEMPLEWKIDAGTNGIASVDFSLSKGKRSVLCRTVRLAIMPGKDPDLSSGAWSPPQSARRTYYVDSRHGDDGRSGLSEAEAWRTLAQVNILKLGPGDRVLLRRGSVFREELCAKARGEPGNWVEIGAYGEGPRPHISLSRHINDRCGRIVDPVCLVVRDLAFCNAGMGLALVCSSEGSGGVLVERCLFHHLEGVYDRLDSHGIPEWRGERGAPNPGGEQSCGVFVGGAHARNVVVRDCEFYQCSNGFRVFGRDVFLSRLFCHDNYAHNTSPHPYMCASRSYMVDSVFDAAGWHAAAGTMGVMMAGNQGLVVRGCHFLNMPDSGSFNDEGGIDFEANGSNCLVEECTFRNNAGAAIEVLGLAAPQMRNLHIRRCRFDRDNHAMKNGYAEIYVHGDARTPRRVACSNGLVEDNGYVLSPGISFYVNESVSATDWRLVGNRQFDFPDELNRAYPFADPPDVSVCGEMWTDASEARLSGSAGGTRVAVRWEQMEGPDVVSFEDPDRPCTRASFPSVGDYRVTLKADNGRLWRTARTAVHVLPKGTRTFKAWDFARNLDAQGWTAQDTGTAYEYLPSATPARDSSSHPVHLACGDYFVVAMKNSANACIATPDDRNVGVELGGSGVNTMRIKMQNHTTSKRMRVWWQTAGRQLEWDERSSRAFDVAAMDTDDTLYEVPLPPAGRLRRLKISFSDGGAKATGTCRIDYIWLGNVKGKL